MVVVKYIKVVKDQGMLVLTLYWLLGGMIVMASLLSNEFHLAAEIAVLLAFAAAGFVSACWFMPFYRTKRGIMKPVLIASYVMASFVAYLAQLAVLFFTEVLTGPQVPFWAKAFILSPGAVVLSSNLILAAGVFGSVLAARMIAGVRHAVGLGVHMVLKR